MKIRHILLLAMMLTGAVCFGGLSLIPGEPLVAVPYEGGDSLLYIDPSIYLGITTGIPDSLILPDPTTGIPGYFELGRVLSPLQIYPSIYRVGWETVHLSHFIVMFPSDWQPSPAETILPYLNDDFDLLTNPHDGYSLLLTPCTIDSQTGQTEIVVQMFPIPEPATLSLLAMGGLALVRKRK